MRKNEDWYIVLDKGISNKKIVEVFFEECGLKPQIPVTINDYRSWGYSPYNKSDFRGFHNGKREFRIPSEWKEAQEYICEEEKELKVGKWYKFEKTDHWKVIGRFTKTGSFDIYLKDYICNEVEGYQEINKIHKNHYHLAVELTQEELEEHLIACAKARGFVKGVKLKPNVGANKTINHTKEFSGKFKFHQSNNVLECVLECGKANGNIFYNNEWAEIIKDELPDINGHKGKFKEKNVVYGCAKINIQSFQNILSCFKGGNRTLKSITLDSGVTITMEQIEQIIKAYESRED